MIGVALKGLAGRKIRALLTAFAIVIGVSMVSGTFILTDTMQKSFNGLFDASYEKTDAVIQGKEIVKDSTNGSGVTLPASLLDEVRALPEVEAAGGTVMPEEVNGADIIGKDGKAVAQESIGTSYDAANARFSPLNLKTGDWPAGRRAGRDRRRHRQEGALRRRRLRRRSTPRPASSTLRDHRHRELRRGRLARLRQHRGLGPRDRAEGARPRGPLRRDLDRREVRHARRPSSSRRSSRSSPRTSRSRTAPSRPRRTPSELNDGMGTIRMFLLGFGGIALLVGAFVIFNTLSITVAQRTREFATLRTLGASRKQVMRSVRLEGLVIGLLASVIGLVAGLGIAKGMIALFSALGVDLPEASTVFERRTVIVSLLLGTGITLLASILPARRATRVPPIAAVREGSTLPPTRMAAHSHNAGLGVTLASLAAISLGIFAGGVSALAVGLLLGVGVLGLFFGIALLAPRLVKPLARVVGLPARRAGGVAGELAGANAVRNPGRTASTAAALMIGLTLVTVVAVLGAGINNATKSAITEQLRRRLRRRRQAGPAVQRRRGRQARGDAGRAERLARPVGHRARAGRAAGDQRHRPGDDRGLLHVRRGPRARTARSTQLGSRRRAREQEATPTDEHLKVGSTRVGHDARRARSARSSSAASTTRREQKPLLGDVSMTQQAFDKAFDNPKNSFTFLAADADAGTALEAAAKDSGDATFHTGAEYPKDATKDMATVMAMLYVLLGFSVIVSLFGMVNTMVLSVFERTREIGMLRTIGMTRRQARRMIRHESVITALIGTTLGLGLGVFLAALVTKAVSHGRPRLVDPRPDAGRVHAGRRRRRHRRGDPPRTAGLAAQRARRAPLRVADDRRHHAVRAPPRPAAHAAGRPDAARPSSSGSGSP